MNPNLDSLLDMLNRSLTNLRVRDYHLLHVEASERCITHKLGEYLRVHLDNELGVPLGAEPGISVDCEYNRYGTEVRAKRLPLYTDLLIEGEPYYITNPDIVIHHRGDQAANLLVVEVKTFFNHRPSAVLLDKLKLVGYLGHPTYYSAGVFLDLGYDADSTTLLEAKLLKKKTVKAKGHEEITVNGTGWNAQEFFWNEGAAIAFTEDGKQAKFRAGADEAAAKLMQGLEDAFGFEPLFH
jgi:hypothetical protein